MLCILRMVSSCDWPRGREACWVAGTGGTEHAGEAGTNERTTNHGRIIQHGVEGVGCWRCNSDEKDLAVRVLCALNYAVADD